MSKANDKRMQSIVDMPPELSSKKESELYLKREKKVRKSNELIRKFRAEMNTTQLKISLYLISQAYTFENTMEYMFDIQEFCKLCGIDYESGGNYKRLKADMRQLAYKHEWVQVYDDPDVDVLVGLVNKVWIYKKTGKIKIRLDEDIKPYILDLRKKWEDNGELYTTFALLYTLPMRSLYSIRLYELLRSWSDGYLTEQRGHYWELDELQEVLGSEYERYTDFRRYVLEIAMREINQYSDLEVSYEAVKHGRRVKYIQFWIYKKNETQLLKVRSDNNKILDGQISFDDYDKHGQLKK